MEWRAGAGAPPAPKKARPSAPRLQNVSQPDVRRLQSMFRDAVDDAGDGAGDAGGAPDVTDDDAPPDIGDVERGVSTNLDGPAAAKR